MLQRLLTLPSQLLEGDEESMDAAPSLEVSLDPADSEFGGESKSDRTQATKKREQRNEEDEDEEDDDEDESKAEQSKHKGRRKAHACKECGRKFSRTHLLRAHRLTHEETSIRCSQCGKSFSQPSKLQAHLRTHTGKTIWEHADDKERVFSHYERRELGCCLSGRFQIWIWFQAVSGNCHFKYWWRNLSINITL